MGPYVLGAVLVTGGVEIVSASRIWVGGPRPPPGSYFWFACLGAIVGRLALDAMLVSRGLAVPGRTRGARSPRRRPARRARRDFPTQSSLSGARRRRSATAARAIESAVPAPIVTSASGPKSQAGTRRERGLPTTRVSQGS